MAFWVYVLRCSDGTYYTGHTDDLEKRIGQHQSGEMPGYTRTRRPVELMWADSVPTCLEALECEMRIKDWSRAKKEALFRGDFDGVKAVSEASRGSGRRSRQAAMPPARSALETNGEREAATPPAPASKWSPTPVEQGEALSRPVSRPAAAPPLIILVRPQFGENIGKAARAMLNFGLTEMRLVAPRDGWPNPSAGPAAAGADVVLEQAQLFDTLAEAVADCAHVYATTVRKRGVTKPVLTPEAAVAEMDGATGRTAILFGAERSGLETDEVALARTIVTVPINPEFGSLNLAQAVILVAYEWSKRRNAGLSLAQPPLTPLDPPAPQAELDGMIDQLLALLEPRGYFYPPDRAAATRATLRNLLTKPGWNSLQVRTLRGVFSAFEKPRRR